MARQIRATEGRQLVIKGEEIPGLLGEQRQRLTRVRCLGNLSGGPAELHQLTEGRAVELVIINDEYRWMHMPVSLWRVISQLLLSTVVLRAQLRGIRMDSVRAPAAWPLGQCHWHEQRGNHPVFGVSSSVVYDTFAGSMT
jgi:hypothetical protein